MYKLAVRPHLPSDNALLVASMRTEDEAEVLATNEDVTDAVNCNTDSSVMKYSVVDQDGNLVAVFGVGIDQDNGCCAWLLSTEAAEANRFAYARTSKKLVKALQESFPVIYAYTDARYHRAVKWMKWMGFAECGRKKTGSGVDLIRMQIGGDKWVH